MHKSWGFRILVLLILFFILFPLVMIAVTAFGEKTIIQFPITGFSLQWFTKAFGSASLMGALRFSFVLAILSSVVALVIGFPASYALTRKATQANEWLLSFFLSPSLIPGIVLGFALYRMLILNLHVNVAVALVIGHVLIVLPYTIRILAAGLRDLDPSMMEAAVSLGAPTLKSVFQIMIPNMRGPILAAVMMSFINSFNNLPVSLFLKGPGVETLPYSLLNYMEYNFDPTISAISLLLMGVSLILMVLMDRFVGISEVQS